MTKVVWLLILVHNADTGVLLHRYEEQMPSFSVSNDPIEDCRKEGVRLAHKLTAHYRAKGFSNAFTNVDCEWRYGRPINPA